MFATVVHIVTPIMLLGLVKILISSDLGFLVSGTILGCALFSLQFIVNHLTNPESFCVLNDLENFYRKEESLPRVRSFLPRFYSMWGRIVKNDWRIPE